MKNLQSVRGQPLMDAGPVGVLQCQMYGLRKGFIGFKGTGKDLLEASLSDSGSMFIQSRMSFEESSVRQGSTLDGFCSGWGPAMPNVWFAQGFIGFKGPGKDLLETLLSASGLKSFQSDESSVC